MYITYEEALQAQKESEDQWLTDPNVVSVGVVPETNELGNQTGSYVVQIGVKSEEAYLNAVNHAASVIPQEYVLHPKGSQTNKKMEKHVRITVVKEGKIEALGNKPFDGNEDIPSAIDNIESSKKNQYSPIGRSRPSKGGDSIGHPSISAGTLGLLIKYVDGPNVGKAYILSNNQVLAANNMGAVGDPIIQPAKHDSGVEGRDTIAYLHRWVPLLTNGTNYVDAAMAEVRDGMNWYKHVIPEVKYIGNPTQLGEAATFHNPLNTVLTELTKACSNRYPSGKTSYFSLTGPLKILNRQYSTQSAPIPQCILKISKSTLVPATQVKRAPTLFAYIGFSLANAIIQKNCLKNRPTTSKLKSNMIQKAPHVDNSRYSCAREFK